MHGRRRCGRRIAATNAAGETSGRPSSMKGLQCDGTCSVAALGGVGVALTGVAIASLHGTNLFMS